MRADGRPCECYALGEYHSSMQSLLKLPANRLAKLQITQRPERESLAAKMSLLIDSEDLTLRK